MGSRKKLSSEEWKEKLSEEQYRVLREKGTERPFSGEYDSFFEDGVYECAGCGQVLFDSESKYDSGCGWPAFSEPEESSVEAEEDSSFGMNRTEVLCSECSGHLGHVFDDGPEERGGKRYCINSAALKFKGR